MPRAGEVAEPVGFTPRGLALYLPSGGFLPEPAGYTRMGVPHYAAASIVSHARFREMLSRRRAGRIRAAAAT